MTEKTDDYILDNGDEITRLTNQHQVLKDAMGGRLLFAPVDLGATSLKILDSATADGEVLMFEKGASNVCLLPCSRPLDTRSGPFLR